MVQKEYIILVFASSILITFILGVLIVFMAFRKWQLRENLQKQIIQEKQNNELEKLEVAISTQEKERIKIARQLHDDVGALLSLAQKNLVNFEDNAEQGKVDFKAVELGKEYISESIQILRTITKGMTPHYLLKFGLVKALENMSRQKSSSLIESFNFSSKIPEKLQISEIVSTHYFYIASELITNLLKHSYPTDIQMKLTFDAHLLKLKIQHNGITLTQRDYERLLGESESLGLENIQYRLNILSGNLILKRFKTYGTIELITKLDHT
jgi:two-component system, NarL family, sensor kinase